jgi:uncharacterized Zn finger protein
VTAAPCENCGGSEVLDWRGFDRLLVCMYCGHTVNLTSPAPTHVRIATPDHLRSAATGENR